MVKVINGLERTIPLRHKSRVFWLREGDKCTKFFHQVTSLNRRNNSIESWRLMVQFLRIN